MGLTTDRNHPDLTRGINDEPTNQAKVYLVLSDEDRAKGFLKPYRDTYKHLTCGTTTKMNSVISETYARDPWFYGATYCVHCQKHRPLIEFVWEPDGESMSPNEWPPEEHQRISDLRSEQE